jgi:probable HAF family extracellular repeat protein
MNGIPTSKKSLAPRRNVGAVLAVSLVFCIWAPYAQAQQYKVTVIPTLGGKSSIGLGINASGQVTGISCLTGFSCAIAKGGSGGKNQHAFIYSSDGSVTDLGTLGGKSNYSLGASINASGQVTGYSYTSGNEQHAFLYSDGVMQDIGTLGGFNSNGNGINDSGQVTGQSDTTGDTPFHAFFYTDGVMQDIGTTGGANSYGTGISNSGFVTGTSQTFFGTDMLEQAFLYAYGGAIESLGAFGVPTEDSLGTGVNIYGDSTGAAYTTSNAQHAFLTQFNFMVDLGALNGAGSVGYGINDNYAVVGTYFTANFEAALAFVYSNTTQQMVDLNTLVSHRFAEQYTLEEATGINNSGQIVANGYKNSNGIHRTFLLSPE